jgi:aspartate/methionine/tyrosine aminotransferase
LRTGPRHAEDLGVSTEPNQTLRLTTFGRAGPVPRARERQLSVVRPPGAWSLLLNVAALGLDCVQVSDLLLEQKVAATPMRGWGEEIEGRHVRFVFSNKPVERLALLETRVRAALAAAGVRA